MIVLGIAIPLYFSAHVTIFIISAKFTLSSIDHKLIMSKWSFVGNSYERPLGDSEFAFFPASQNALGDM